MMTKEEVVKKNLDLHAEWMKYTFENPDVLDRIPKGAVLVILPEDDKELYAENYKILEQNKKKGIPVFVVTMKTPKPHISSMEIVAA
jgi:siroheme synthase (precorrin-2 oxidase/ferrochelatase)